MIKTETKNLHTKVDIVSRGKGHKVIAKAAYNARAKIEDERYGKTEDYTNIKDLVFSKVYLPAHVPKEFSDRSFLWNDVERFEKSSNSQLARNLIFALPRELNEEQRIELLEQFVKENFTDKGMIADVNVHNPDASDGLEQPHAHILLTLREIDEKGKWKPKSRKEYILDEKGERIKLPSGNWKSRKVNVNDWNKRTKAKEWRENFSKLANEYFEKNNINKRIDPRTFEEQGRDEVATIHMGVASYQMEKKGIKTERGNINREIVAINSQIKSLKEQIISIGKWLEELKSKVTESIKRITKEKETEYEKEPSLFDIYSYFNIYSIMQEEKRKTLTGENRKRKSFFDSKMSLKTLSYMSTRKVKTILDVQLRKDEMKKGISETAKKTNACKREIKKLNVLLKQADIIAEYGKVYKTYQQKDNSVLGKITGNTKEKFRQEHKEEIGKYERARAIINKNTGSKAVKGKEWLKKKQELESILRTCEMNNESFKEELKMLNHINYLVNEVNKEMGIDIQIELDIEIEKAKAKGEKPSTIAILEKLQKEKLYEDKKKEYAKQKSKKQERQEER